MTDDLINALGAMGETCGFFMKQLLAQGFTRKEAIQLTQAYLESTITGGRKSNE